MNAKQKKFFSEVRNSRIVVTRGVSQHEKIEGRDIEKFINRHANGDWGDLDPFDMLQNDIAIEQHHRVMSVYYIPKSNEKVYVITEHDRSITTVLLPSEY